MKKGDFIEIEFVGRVKATGEIFDLTSEELAKKEGLYRPGYKYGPALVVIGSDMTIPGVMKQLEAMEVGEEREFDVQPKDGFGLRSPKLIRVLPISKFTENRINPVPGEYYEIDGMRAKIQSVSGGRVRVDFNNPLAGKVLTYRVKILRKIEQRDDKIKKVLEYYGIENDGFKLKEGKLTIKAKNMPNKLTENIVKEILTKWINDIKNVLFEKSEKTKTNRDSSEQKFK